MTPQEMIDGFISRDKNAMEEYNQGSICLEAVIELINGRVKDLVTICLYLLKREAERDAATSPPTGNAMGNGTTKERDK